ncbi:MAG TPA: hypothetical protein IAC15_08165 [Candidatus Onthomonas avicola]|nr:hypothetical protein [Candidatus Onthomonas avicola]
MRRAGLLALTACLLLALGGYHRADAARETEPLQVCCEERTASRGAWREERRDLYLHLRRRAAVGRADGEALAPRAAVWHNRAR